ncbi:Transcription factor GTE8 [Diplonema papillatum]|nr:Transcription factor GTE8 [Diplonema papillatum]|eukprot:gene10686-16441_t
MDRLAPDEPSYADYVPKCTKITKAEWEAVVKGAGDGSDGMDDVHYVKVGMEEASAAAVRSLWIRKHVWDGWANPFTCTETTREMEAELRRMISTGSGAHSSPGMGKGKGKGKVKRKSLPEVAKIALDSLLAAEEDQKEKAERYEKNTQVVRCAVCATSYSVARPPKRRGNPLNNAASRTPQTCPSCKHPAECCCLVTPYCKACGKTPSNSPVTPFTAFATNREALCVTLAKNPGTGSLGLTFQGMVLSRTSTADAANFLGHRVARIGSYAVNTPSDLFRAIESVKTLDTVRLTFYPLYQPHSLTMLLGKSAPSRDHDIINSRDAAVKLDRVLSRVSTLPSALHLTVFGEDLVLENVSVPGKATLFRCVTKSYFMSKAASIGELNPAAGSKEEKQTTALRKKTAPPKARKAANQVVVDTDDETSEASTPAKKRRKLAGLKQPPADAADPAAPPADRPDGAGEENPGFRKEDLRAIYPSPFAPDLVAAAAPAKGSKSAPPHPLAQCKRALRKLFEAKQGEEAFSLFLRPVDPARDRAPDYLSTVRKPMDLGTIQAILDNNLYSHPTEMLSDIALVWKNCRQYNPPGHYLHIYANTLEAAFAKLYNTELQKHPPVEPVPAALPPLTPPDNDDIPPNSLAAEMVSQLSELPCFCDTTHSIAAKLTSVRGACRWATSPHQHHPDRLDIYLRIVPAMLPNDLIHSVLAIIQQFRDASAPATPG